MEALAQVDGERRLPFEFIASAATEGMTAIALAQSVASAA
jgi:hypothetical protein